MSGFSSIVLSLILRTPKVYVIPRHQSIRPRKKQVNFMSLHESGIWLSWENRGLAPFSEAFLLQSINCWLLLYWPSLILLPGLSCLIWSEKEAPLYISTTDEVRGALSILVWIDQLLHNVESYLNFHYERWI